MTIRDKIIQEFENGNLTFKTEQKIYATLNILPREHKAIHKLLTELVNEGFLYVDRQGCYSTPAQAGAIVGTIRAHERGFAFLIPAERAEGENDYFIPHRNLHGALNRDKVLAVRVHNTADEVDVVKIIERGYTRIVGTFEKDKRAGYVLPDDNRMDTDIFIPLHLCGNAKVGDKVVAEITSFPQGKMPGGRIVEVLGEGGDFYAEELSIIRSHDLKEEFPPEVEQQAEKVSREPVFLGDRTDLRDLFTITIDGDDTRDIDDAVSIEQQGDTYRLGVHIADVSHYVKRGTPLDNEAYARGTSVYFPDRVLPMLPKALSNGACSLNEGEDRYALSVFITFDKEGNRLSSHICESMICSNHRTTYRQIEAIINGDKDACAQNPDLIEPVAVMTSLTYLLDKKREERGGIELDVKEAHIYIDENGELVIPDYERLCSQRLIEHFMVAANEAVAEEMHKLGVPFLYRIHEVPAPEKVATLTTFLRDLDIHVNLGDEPTPAQYARILKNVEGNPYASVVNRVMLRSMQKARYSEENVGHFGLASSCYCHFTSPIRRYPDLFIHRVIKCVLHGETDKAFKLYSSIAHEAAIDTSECERRADEAERDVDDLYKVVYLSDRIGTEYDAVISGVTSFGIFAELPNTIEGLIRLERLPEDTYEYFEDRYLLKGTKHSYRIGQPIRIRVDGCDWGNMRTEFTIIEEEMAKN